MSSSPPPSSRSTTTGTAATATSPPPSDSLPTLAVEFPPDHPAARRAAAAAAAAASSNTPTKAVENAQAFLLSRNSLPLSIPNSPAEQARRMSIGPASRRNSILAIPPVLENIAAPLDHLPAPGTDTAIDEQEIAREIEEIDTIG